MKKLGLEYIRLPVRDHWKPADEIIDQFVCFVKALPKDAWVHFHCHGGSGRTTTFLVMYDIIRNGPHVNLKDIEDWLNVGALKRLDIIEKFYLYVQDPDGYLSRSWTEWLNLKKAEFTS